MREVASAFRTGAAESLALELAGRAVKGSLGRSLSESARLMSCGIPVDHSLIPLPNGLGRSISGVVSASKTLEALAENAGNLSDSLEKQHVTRGRFTQSIVYPLVLASMGLVVSVYAFAVVIPELVRAVEVAGGELPPATMALLEAVGGLRAHWPFFLPGGAAILAALYRHRVRICLCLLPFFRRLAEYTSWSQFLRHLADATRRGTADMTHLYTRAENLPSAEVACICTDAWRLLSYGFAPSISCSHMPDHVRLAVMSSGKDRAKRLLAVAELYEDNSNRTSSIALSLVQPILTAVVSCAIGVVAVLMCLPALSMTLNP